MKKTGVMIVVAAKGNFGYSPYFERNIVREVPDETTGEPTLVKYTIDEAEWQEGLFERPSPEWLSIAEREALAPVEPVLSLDSAPMDESQQIKKSGRGK